MGALGDLRLFCANRLEANSSSFYGVKIAKLRKKVTFSNQKAGVHFCSDFYEKKIVVKHCLSFPERIRILPSPRPHPLISGILSKVL